MSRKCLLDWLPDHLDADLSVPALARRVSLSDRQFSRVFKQQIGCTPAEYVERVRVDAACHRLETTENAVEEIARPAGSAPPRR